jgi:hypothetical protein
MRGRGSFVDGMLAAFFQRPTLSPDRQEIPAGSNGPQEPPDDQIPADGKGPRQPPDDQIPAGGNGPAGPPSDKETMPPLEGHGVSTGTEALGERQKPSGSQSLEAWVASLRAALASMDAAVDRVSKQTNADPNGRASRASIEARAAQVLVANLRTSLASMDVAPVPASKRASSERRRRSRRSATSRGRE